MGIRELGTAIKSATDERIKREARAIRGVIQGGKFISGAKSYPYVQAVEVNAKEGGTVWAQLSGDGKAVVIGD